MSSTVKGVEVNEFSRFIDHTLATPWETFISDIEKTLRSVQGHRSVSSSNNIRGSIEYMGVEFEVQKVVVNENATSIPEKLLRLLSGFRNESVVLIYSMENPSSFDPNLRGSLLSAISIAIRSVPDLVNPVFFTLHPLKADVVDWVGYRPTASRDDLDRKIISWSRFETLSMNLSRTSDRHPLFFFDGIRKVYQRRIAALGLDGDQRVLENFVSKITHFYRFEIAQWLGGVDKVVGRPKYALIPNQLNRDMDELLRMFLLRKMSFKAELLSGMNVSVEYRESNQHGIIDNDSYSTLLPSRQLPSQFHLRPTWKPVELQQPFSEHETMVLPWKSQSIRNLLVFLILASFTKKQGDVGYNFESNYTLDDMMQCVHYEDMAELVGQLSIPTQMAFYNKIPTTNIAAAASVSSTGGGNSYGSSSRSSSRSMTPLPSVFAAAVTDVTSPKVPLSTTTASAAAAAAVRGRGQSLSSMSSSASLATTGNNNTNNASGGTATADAQSQAIESDRYFQPVLRYLFQTEPSAPLAELLGGKQAGPGMFLDIIDLATPRTPHSTTGTGANTNNPPKPIDELLALLPTPVDGVHSWLEHFAVIAGLLPTKTTNIIRLWQHCLRELQQHFDLQAPVPAFAHIVGVANKTSTGEEDEILSKRRAYIAAERKKPLYARMLWEDVLFQKGIQDDIAVTMPHPPPQSLFVPTYLRGSSSSSSLSSSSSPSPCGPPPASSSSPTSPEYSSILLQHLQMVHFCTVVQQESPYATLSPPTVTTWSMDTASFRPSSTEAHPMHHIQQPKSLLRRIPLTEDMLAMQQHLSQKIFLDASRTFSSNPLLRFQVVLPNLLPHMQSFRQANPQATVRDFYHWYGLDQAPLSLIDTLIGEADHVAPDEPTTTTTTATEAHGASGGLRSGDTSETTTVHAKEEGETTAVVEVNDDAEGHGKDGEGREEEEEETGPSSFSDPVAPAYLAAMTQKQQEPQQQQQEPQKQQPAQTPVVPTIRSPAERLLKALDILWTQHCTLDAEKDAALMPPPTEMTKTQFSADKEMTKAIAALERMSVAGLGEELLYLALCFNWRLLQQTVQALHSDEARHRAYQAMKPMIHKIAELHRLRARYPSSTFTRIMRNTFLQAMETPSTTHTTNSTNAAASAHVSSSVLATPPPAPLPPSADGTATIGSLPPLQVPPPGEANAESSTSKITSLVSLIRCYDELAEEMAQLEDIVYRLVQLEPVRTTLQPADAASPHSPAAAAGAGAAVTSPAAGRKVTVTRSQPSAATVTDALPPPPPPQQRSLSFTKRAAAPKTQWARLLRRWVPIVSSSSPKGRLTSSGPLPYALKDETEKQLLLQRMKVLTSSGTVASDVAHDWHSTDGRELGAASAKRFDLRALLPSSSAHGIATDEHFLSDVHRRNRRRRRQQQQQLRRRQHHETVPTNTAPPAQPVKLEFDDDDNDKTSTTTNATTALAPLQKTEQKSRSLSLTLDAMNNHRRRDRSWARDEEQEDDDDDEDEDDDEDDDDDDDDENHDGYGNADNGVDLFANPVGSDAEEEPSHPIGERYDVSLTVYCERQELQALWEYAEED